MGGISISFQMSNPSSGDVWNNMRSSKYGPPSSEGDILGVLLDYRDPNNGDLYFFKVHGAQSYILNMQNGRNLGRAFSSMKGKLFPAVYLYYSQTSATFIPKVFVPHSVLATIPENGNYFYLQKLIFLSYRQSQTKNIGIWENKEIEVIACCIKLDVDICMILLI